LILSTHLRFGLPSGLFPSGFLTNILYAFLFSPHSSYMPRIQGIRPGPKPLLNVRNNLILYGEELLAPRPTPQLEDHPMSAVRDCLFNIFAAALWLITILGNCAALRLPVVLVGPRACGTLLKVRNKHHWLVSLFWTLPIRLPSLIEQL
jgi:hypothetical protein